MRFMLLMIPRGYETSGPDIDLDPEAVKAMMAYNTALQNAGVLLSLDGLHPPVSGARVYFDTGKPVVVQAPFPGVTEVLGGFWVIDVASRDEAIAWAMRCPAGPREIVEVRRIQEMEDFSPEIQEAAKGLEGMQTGAR